jgi:hypothetical protein
MYAVNVYQKSDTEATIDESTTLDEVKLAEESAIDVEVRLYFW